MPAASTGPQKGPNSSPWQCLTTRRRTNASKVSRIGLQILLHSLYSPDRLPLLQASWQLFARKMFPQPAGGRKYFPRVYWILKHRFLCYRNKQTFFDGKNVLTVMVPILIDKDVFEPSYNGLKFMVQNHRYFCTNLLLSFKSPRASFLCVLLVNPISQPSPVSREGRENSTFPWGNDIKNQFHCMMGEWYQEEKIMATIWKKNYHKDYSLYSTWINCCKTLGDSFLVYIRRFPAGVYMPSRWVRPLRRVCLGAYFHFILKKIKIHFVRV